MEKIIQFHPAFDKRNPDPNKNYGIHGVELRMIYKSDKGVVQFVLYTNWQLPEVTEEYRSKMRPDNHFLFEPMASDLGYHSLTPHYEGQTCRENCPYLDGQPCYYDGSTLNAEEPYRILLTEGSDGVWKFLESYYNQIFE